MSLKRFSIGSSSRASLERIGEGSSRTAAPYFLAEDDRPPSTKSKAPDVSVSLYIREVVSGACTLFQEIPGVSVVCKTMLSLEELVYTAKGNKKELAVLLELCDVVTKGALDRWSEYPGPYDGLAALQRHVESAQRVAAMCNKGPISRFALGRKISRSMVTVKSNIVNFATLHNLVLSTALHIKLAKMEAALAAKERERERLEAEEAARRLADAEKNASSKKSRGVMGVLKRIGAASTGAFRVRDWYGARRDSVGEGFKTCDRIGLRRPCLLLAGGASVVLAVVCGRQAWYRASSSRR